MRTPRGLIKADDFQNAPNVANQWLNSVNTAVGAYVGGPAVVAAQTSVQSIPSGGTGARIIFNNLEYDLDPQHSYNTTTGIFQPHIAGYYLISATVGLLKIDTIYIYKNGSAYRKYSPVQINTSTTTFACTISQPIFLNGSTDYVEIWASHSNLAAQNTDSPFNYAGLPIGATTFFSANLIRPA